MLASGSRASALNGSASLFSLTCSQTLLDIQLTAPASNVCCRHKQWIQSGDSTIFCQRKQNAEVIGNICTPSSSVYVINSGTRQCYENWRKEEEKKCHYNLPYFALSQHSRACRLQVLWKCHPPFHEWSITGTTLLHSVTAMLEFGQDNVPITSAISNNVKTYLHLKIERWMCSHTLLSIYAISIGLWAYSSTVGHCYIKKLAALEMSCLVGMRAKILKGKKKKKLKNWCSHEKLTWWHHQGCKESYPKSMPS